MKITVRITGGDDGLQDTLASEIEALVGEFELETSEGNPANVSSVSIDNQEAAVVLTLEIEVESNDE